MPHLFWVVLATLLLSLTACNPAPPSPQATGLPVDGTQQAVTSTLVASASAPAPGTPVPPTLLPTATPSPTPTPITLVVCQPGEPTSLYRYSADPSHRAAIFEALFDGPIDLVGYAAQPVLLEKLPTVADGSATLQVVTVNLGDLVVSTSGAIVPLAAGVQLYQPDGSSQTYSGEGSITTIQLTAQFVLKPALLWSDGSPLTAADSVFSYEIAQATPNLINRFALDRTARYELLDDRTTRWTGLPGWWDAEYFLRFWPPLSRAAAGGLSAAELQANLVASTQPLGWGAFRVGPAGWVPGQPLVLERNPHYFRAAPNFPYFERVIYRFGLSPTELVTNLQTGQCDVVLDGSRLSTELEGQLPAWEAMAQAGQAQLQFVSANTFEHLDFGILPAEGYKRPAGNALFQDPTLRQAVAYCLDRQALITELLGGHSEVPTTYVPTNHPDVGGVVLTQYPFDPARGQALLDAAGWRDRDGDGVRELGRATLTLNYATGPAEDPFRTALATTLQTQLRLNCGIDLQPAFYDTAALYATWPDGVLFGRQFDLGGFAWRIDRTPACTLYLTSALPADDNPGGTNNVGYTNIAFDQACQAARLALDPDTRRAQHQRALQTLAQDLPFLPLFFPFRVGVATPRVLNFQTDVTAPDLWNIEALAAVP